MLLIVSAIQNVTNLNTLVRSLSAKLERILTINLKMLINTQILLSSPHRHSYNLKYLSKVYILNHSMANIKIYKCLLYIFALALIVSEI